MEVDPPESRTVVLEDFNSGGDLSSVVRKNISDAHFGEGSVMMEYGPGAGPEGYAIFGNPQGDFDPAVHRFARMRMALVSDLKTPRKVDFYGLPLSKNGAEARIHPGENAQEVIFDLRDLDSPSGHGFRIDPFNYTNNETVDLAEIDYVMADQYRTIGLEFDRAGDLSQVRPANILDMDVSAGTLKGVAETLDPQLFLEKALPVDASLYKHLEIRMKADADSAIRYYWLARGRMDAPATVDIGVADGDFHTYVIDFSDEPDWKGEIAFSRLDPTDKAGHSFEIDSIRFVSRLTDEDERRLADHALEAPEIRTKNLEAYQYENLSYGMSLGLARTSGGRLWASWNPAYDGPPAYTMAAFSDDGGNTWQGPKLVLDAHSDDLPLARSIEGLNFWTEPGGRLRMFFNQGMHQYDGRMGIWTAVCDNPDAADPVWSKPERISDGWILNKPTVLSNGDWVLSTFLLQEPQRPVHPLFRHTFDDLKRYHGITLLVSRDQGKTWEQLSGKNEADIISPYPDWQEPMLVERKDGALWLWFRTLTGVMYSLSTDQGKTWSNPEFVEGVKQPNARFFISRLASGNLLLVKMGKKIDGYAENAPNHRGELTAWISDDEGKSWKGGLMLDERSVVTHPDGVQGPDGMIYISYDWNRAPDGNVLLARFFEEDVIAGKLVNPKSSLRTLIYRPLNGKSASAK